MLKIADAQLCPICGGMVHLTMDRDYFNTCRKINKATCITLECGTCNLKMTEFSGITGGSSLDYDSTLDTLITRWNSLPSTRPLQPSAPTSCQSVDPSNYEMDETTTWRDLAIKYTPYRLGEQYLGGVRGCPRELHCDVENTPYVGNEFCLSAHNGGQEECRACWDRKVLESTQHDAPTSTEEYGTPTQQSMNHIIHQIATTKECSIETAQELDRLMHEEKLLPPQLYLRMNLLGGCMQVLTAPDVQSHQVAFPFQSTFNFDNIEDIPDFLLQLYGMVDKYNEYLHKAGSVVFRPDKDKEKDGDTLA